MFYSWYTRLLNYYREHVGIEGGCYLGLEYRYFLIKSNLTTQQGKEWYPSPDELRKMIAYEIDAGKVEDDTDQFAWLITTYLNQPTLTRKTLARVTDEQLAFAMIRYAEYSRTQYSREERQEIYTRMQKSLQKKQCACCKTTENILGQYKSCGRCKQIHYCRPECQKLHWKEGGHKKNCAPR